MGDQTTLVTAIVGAVSGIGGLILGVLNTSREMRRDKVRLKVTPQHVVPIGAFEGRPWNFEIEVVNLSEFPVVIADLGFQLNDDTHATLGGVQGFQPTGSLPKRLEPHTAYSKYFTIDNDLLSLKRVRCAYARTQCGTLATGSSGALKQVIREGVTRGR